MVKLAALVLGLMLSFAVHAKEAAPAAADPQLEKRVMTLAEELRCLVCQNQTIADSAAPLAVDLREQVREQLKQGRSDREIIDYMVERYGDFVLYRPPLKITTMLLWFGPVLLMIVAVFVLMRRLRAGRNEPAAPLSATDHARAAALLAEGDEKR